MSASFPIVAFAGSRSLPSSAQGPVTAIVQSCVRAGKGIATGCAWGADWLALQPAARLAPRGAVQVFSAWSSASEQSARLLPLVSSGVSVRWLAGGGLSRPVVERLKARSKVMVSFASQSGQGAALVMFVSGGWQQSPGSWFTAIHAVKSGLPVVVFPVGCSVQSFPSLGNAGQWQVAGAGVWGQGFRWVP